MKRHAVAYVRNNKLYKQPEYQKLLEQHFGDQYNETIDRWTAEDKEEEELNEQRDLFKVKAERAQVKRNNAKYVIKRSEVYDFDKPSEEQKDAQFELQQPPTNIEYQFQPDPEPEPPVRPVEDLRFNLFDMAQENMIPVLISQYSNTF